MPQATLLGVDVCYVSYRFDRGEPEQPASRILREALAIPKHLARGWPRARASGGARLGTGGARRLERMRSDEKLTGLDVATERCAGAVLGCWFDTR